MYKAIGLITLGKHWKYKCLKYIQEHDLIKVVSVSTVL